MRKNLNYQNMFLLEREYRLLRFLEWLFGEDFLNDKKNKKHAAYQDYQLLIFKGRLIRPKTEKNSDNHHLNVARLNYNSTVLANVSSNNYYSSTNVLNFGRFEDYGDKYAQKYIHDVKYDPKQYETLFTELCAASWLKMHHWQIKSMEEEGMPDFIAKKDKEEPIVIECKRMRSSSYKTYSKRVVEDAARKFKRFYKKENNRFRSVLFIDASGELSKLILHGETNVSRAKLDSQKEKKDELIKHLRNRLENHSSIDWIVIIYEQIDVFRNATEITRNSETLSNENTVAAKNFPISQYYFFLSVTTRPVHVNRSDVLYWWPSETITIRRNAICSCGSGLRYKHCHGKCRD